MDDCVSIREEQRRKLEERADRERDEIALRFAVSLAGGDMAHPDSHAANEWGDSTAYESAVIRMAYRYADTFLAERARQPGAPK